MKGDRQGAERRLARLVEDLVRRIEESRLIDTRDLDSPSPVVLRKQWARKVERGDVECSRCGELIDPRDRWDLDHIDGGRPLRLPRAVPRPLQPCDEPP